MEQQQSEFEAVVVPHAASLLRFARRLTGNPQTAEDVLQETLLRAWRGLASLRGGANPRAWLFRVLLNTWYSEGRRRRARPVEAPMREAGHVFLRMPAEAAEVNQALSRLPEEQRAVLLLAVVEGFTCLELAGILGIPIGTVMSRLSRARAAMRELVNESNKKAGAGLK